MAMGTVANAHTILRTVANAHTMAAPIEITKSLKINFVVNNIFNEEYCSRPADIQPPRNFLLQLQ